MKLGFVGGGAMAEAMIAGVLRNKAATAAEIAASDVAPTRVKYLRDTYAVAAIQDNVAAVQGADLVILAVKPQNATEVLAGLKGKLSSNQTILSIMAGVTISTIAKGAGHEAVVRAMPNTPGQIGQGISVWTATAAVDQMHRKAAGEVLAALGREVAVAEEKYLDAATALSGSGPAYVFLFIEALIDAGVYLGLSRDLARVLAVQTVKGSATMAEQTGLHPRVLQDMVTSPGGTTIEALLVLEEQGFKGIVMKAVNAAHEKSKRLGESAPK